MAFLLNHKLKKLYRKIKTSVFIFPAVPLLLILQSIYCSLFLLIPARSDLKSKCYFGNLLKHGLLYKISSYLCGMNTQEIQAEKLDLIGWIYSIQDISIIEKIKDIQKNIVIEKYETSLKPMSQIDLTNRAKEANIAIKNKDVISQENLIKESQNW